MNTISDSGSPLNNSRRRQRGARRYRDGAAMAGEPESARPDRAPRKVYCDSLQSFMREHELNPDAAERLLPDRYRPRRTDGTWHGPDADGAADGGRAGVQSAGAVPAGEARARAALEAFRVFMAREVFPRLRARPTFPSWHGDTLRDWERRAGLIVRDDRVRLSACGRRGGVESGARRRRKRRPRNRDIWRWHDAGHGPLTIVADIAADWPELQIGVRRVQQIIRARRMLRAERRAERAAERAAAARRRRERRDAEIVQRMQAGGAVRYVAYSVGVGPSTVRRACAAAGVPVSARAAARAARAAAERDAAERRRAEDAWLADFYRRRGMPEPVPLWKVCVSEMKPRVELYGG